MYTSIYMYNTISGYIKLFYQYFQFRRTFPVSRKTSTCHQVFLQRPWRLSCRVHPWRRRRGEPRTRRGGGRGPGCRGRRSPLLAGSGTAGLATLNRGRCCLQFRQIYIREHEKIIAMLVDISMVCSGLNTPLSVFWSEDKNAYIIFIF